MIRDVGLGLSPVKAYVLASDAVLSHLLDRRQGLEEALGQGLALLFTPADDLAELLRSSAIEHRVD